MKSMQCLPILLATFCLSLAASPEYKAKVITALAVCSQEQKVNMKEIIDIVKADKIPETQKHKCVAGCFLYRMGYVTDLKVDWGKLKALNPQKYDTPDLVEKANKVADNCSKVVTAKASNICDLGAPTMKCLKEEAQKVKLPKPDVKLS